MVAFISWNMVVPVTSPSRGGRIGLTPIQKLVGGGCHLNRRIDDIILSSGFDMRLFENFFIKGPPIGSFMYRGVAERNGVGQ